MTATHEIVTELTVMIENVGHKLFLDSAFLSPELYDDLLTET
jgi:hypothetical protein